MLDMVTSPRVLVIQLRTVGEHFKVHPVQMEESLDSVQS